MDQFGGLLSPETMARRDTRTLADVLEAGLRRKHGELQNVGADIQNQQAAQNLDLGAKTLQDKVDEQKYQALGALYGLSPKRTEATQADIEGGMLGGMFPGQSNQPPLPNQAQAVPPQFGGGTPVNQFAGKSLAELRAIKQNAGPVGTFIGKFVDPMIAQKSFDEEVTPALAEIHAASALPGGTKLEARQKAQALTGILAKYPHVADDPKITKAIAEANPKNTDFNPATGAGVNNRLKSALITDFAKERNDFKIRSDAYVTARNLAASSAWGSGTGDQALMDQQIIFETGKPPTEAQYRNQATKYGFGDMIDQVTGRLKTSAKLTPTVRDMIMNDLEQQAKVRSQGFNNAIQQTSARALNNGIAPEDILEVGQNKAIVDSLLSDPYKASSETPSSGLSPDKAKRLAELRAKKAAGTLK